MKRLVFLTIAFSFFSYLPAQTAKMHIVGNPKKLSSEFVGERDANNRICAGVQVISDMTGFQYDAYNGVVKVSNKPGQDMVFLQPDERVLEIFKSGYKPLKIILSEVGIYLESREVWQIEISGEKKLSRVPVVFITRPEGARIFIDEEDKGLIKKITLSSGSHNIKIIKEGFEPLIKTIQVDEKNTLFEYTLREIEDVPLQITTTPDKAAVYIDNLKFGQTPLSDFYPSGKYPLRIEKEWYVTYEDFIEIKTPLTKMNYKLRPDFGSLSVTSSPQSGLDIYIDGKIQNVKTPHTFSRLRPGIYRISAKSILYETTEQNIEIKRARKQKVNLISQPNFGSLTVTSSPQKGLDIFLNGKQQNVKTPHTFTHLDPGLYRVAAKSKLYQVQEQSIEVKRGGQHRINLISEGNFAVLNINTLDGARIYLNGQRIYNLKNIQLEPQVARLKADLPPKAKPKELRVTLKKGDSKNIDLFPEIPSGTIQVAVVPFKANIELKGDAGELYTAKQSKSFKDIPVGTYKLKVGKDGYKTFSKSLRLYVNKTIKELISLEEGFDISENMVFVKGGSFVMGSNRDNDDEKPAHRVTVNDFYMNKYEVTQEEWRSVMKKNPSNFSGDNNPVECVSWYKAAEFCNKLSEREGFTPCYLIEGVYTRYDSESNGYRLPTEAEWEYAAHGGQKTRSFKYAGSNNLNKVAWYLSNSGRKTHPVGQKQPNELGLYDMSGNVWEWCSDWYGNKYYQNSPSNNPTGPLGGTKRVLRGGSFIDDLDRLPTICRNINKPDIGFLFFGFRIVRNP